MDRTATYYVYSAAWNEAADPALTSEPQVLGGRLRVRWIARQDAGQTYAGTDFVEFAPDGRVSRVTMFSDDPV